MTKISTLHQKWMEKPEYRQAYEAMAPEFELAAAIIAARTKAGLTQAELAERIGTKQPYVARLESGTTNPSHKTLERIAEATGSRLRIRFEPQPSA